MTIISLRDVWIIFRKELTDSLRDRKTLLFMLLIPTLTVPVAMMGMSKMMIRFQQKKQVQEIVIAASPASQAAYLQCVHQWFTQTPTAKGLKIVQSPLFQALIKPEQLSQIKEIPANLDQDPNAFAAWVRGIAGKAREGIDNPELADRKTEPKVKLPKESEKELIEFYQVAIKGLGLVRFVDPADLPDAPADFDKKAIPEDFRSMSEASKIASALRDRTIHGYLIMPENVGSLVSDPGKSLEATFLRDRTADLSGEAQSRMTAVFDAARRAVVAKRLEDKKLSPAFVKPISLSEKGDFATKTDVAMTMIGGFLPFIVIMFTFLGGMYPAIDLGAGEKERNTLETLILAPVGRTEIALGKFLVILLASLVSAFLGVVSMAVSFRYTLPSAIVEQMDVQFEPMMGVWIALLTIPPAAAFSGLFLAISILARSFKEAQNYIAPLQFFIILPGMAGIIPGLELNWALAATPLVNVSLLFKEFLKGHAQWGYYFLSLGSCFLLAAICVAYAVRQFRDEKVLFRT